MSEPVTVGIDYGTTNTVVALRFRAMPIGLEDGRTVLPSAVAYPPSGVTLVGSGARRRRAIDPRHTVLSSKRLLGRRSGTAEVEQFAERHPLELVDRDDGVPRFKVRAGFLSAEEIAATIIGAATTDIPVTADELRAVVTVPGSAGEAQREATARAAAQCGFRDALVIDEPVATAHAYLTGKASSARYAAVYDLGGGTFDLSIIDCRKRPFAVVAQGGDLYLGGDDIDRDLANWAAEEIAASYRWDLRADPLAFDRLVLACERAKISLASTDEVALPLARIDPAAPDSRGALAVTRAVFDEIVMATVYRTFVVCDAVLAEAGLKAGDIEQVLLAGGATQTPMVRESVARYFGREPRTDYSAVEVVALGASLA